MFRRFALCVRVGPLMRTMGEISDHPELLALYRTHLFGPRVAQIRPLLERPRQGRDR